jgi:hypothetical protein
MQYWKITKNLRKKSKAWQSIGWAGNFQENGIKVWMCLGLSEIRSNQCQIAGFPEK